MVLSGAFVFLSIFVLRTTFSAFNCERDSVTGISHLKVEPAIVCNLEDPEYEAVHFRGMLGIAMYVCMYSSFVVGSWFKRDLFAFLGDKFEDRWYFWELLLVARKIGIMYSFQFFANTPAQSWLFGSMVVVVALVAHAL